MIHSASHWIVPKKLFRPSCTSGSKRCNQGRSYCKEAGNGTTVPPASDAASTDGFVIKSRPIKELEEQLPPHLKERRRKRDHIIKSFTDTVRISVINNTNSVANAKKRHGMSDTATRLVGRAMAAASLLAGWQYGEERVILTFNGSGPIGTITAEAIRNGEVRAYTSEPNFIMPVGTPLGFALGAGSLKVTKVLYNQANPYHSVVPLAAADITSDLQRFYDLSEQIPAHVELETHVNYLGQVTFSGGLIIEALPPKETNQSNKDFVKPYQERLHRLPPLSVLFGEDSLHLKEVLHKIAPGEIQEENVQKLVTDFHCRCSKDKFKKNLVTLGPDGLKEFFALAGEEKTLKCHYCSTVYYLTDQDMRDLMQEMLTQRKQAALKRMEQMQEDKNQ